VGDKPRSWFCHNTERGINYSLITNVLINDLLSIVIKFKMTKTQQVLAAKFHPHIMCPHIYNFSLPNPCLLTQTAANTSANSYDKHKKIPQWW
jgi:hypothetical protein